MNFDFSLKTVVSPINKNIKTKSNVDYHEQQHRNKIGEKMMWDDAKGNPTNFFGGMFGFVHNGSRNSRSDGYMR